MTASRPRNDAPVAVIDLDGTLCDYDGAAARDVERALGGDKVSAATRARIERLVTSQPGWWAGLKPLPMGFRILRLLRGMGFRLAVLTKGPAGSPGAWSEKVAWCTEHLPDADVTVTHDKALVHGRVMVDDWPEGIEGWLRWRPQALVLMPAQPWNRGFRHGRVRRIATARDLARVKPELAAIAKS